MNNPAKQTRRSEAEIRTLLNLCDEKNLTVVEFCHAHKIHKATYYNWRNKYGAQVDKPACFVAVQLDQGGSQSALFGEIEFASKVIVRLYHRVEASYFKTLLK